MDCQAAKEFLSQHQIDYTGYDLTKVPEKESEMVKRTGSKIVPGIIFLNTGLSKFLKQPKIFIGFEVNKKEIKALLHNHGMINIQK
ncbi:glutaredoxin domain-containing protein [Cytobacillus gottheilii]|uniref:glutaredoxin domain-containing protein n=1 Tax=Cytobacillus gottheilii TaxID=859144 RepID=UPI003CD0D23E